MGEVHRLEYAGPQTEPRPEYSRLAVAGYTLGLISGFVQPVIMVLVSSIGRRLGQPGGAALWVSLFRIVAVAPFVVSSACCLVALIRLGRMPNRRGQTLAAVGLIFSILWSLVCLLPWFPAK